MPAITIIGLKVGAKFYHNGQLFVVTKAFDPSDLENPYAYAKLVDGNDEINFNSRTIVTLSD